MTWRRLLILGGTADAAELAGVAIARYRHRMTVISSLAGRTEIPGDIPGQVRVGGFGGVEGLVKYLRAEKIDFVIDATHPFAAAMSRHAALACAQAGVPRLALQRPDWPLTAGERRIAVPDMAGAAAKLRELGARRVFVTSGAKDLAALADLTEAWLLVRLIEPPAEPPPLAHYALIFARGPFTEVAEHGLMEEHGIDALLTKDSGGEATYGKVIAARDLGIPVVIIGRPASDVTNAVDNIEAALDWLEGLLKADG